MCSLLLKAKILFWYKEKDKEPEMRFKKKTFDDALLLIPSYTEGIEAEVSKLKDPSIKCLRSNKAAPPKKKQWFIRIGCTAVATRNWIAHQSAAKQVAQCQRPPRASVNLSRVLFMECSIVFNELDKAHSNTYEPVAITPSEEGQQHPVASVAASWLNHCEIRTMVETGQVTPGVLQVVERAELMYQKGLVGCTFVG